MALSQKCVTADRSVDVSLSRAMHSVDENQGSVLRPGDICVNSTGTGTLGRAGLIESEALPGTTFVADGHVTVIRANPSLIVSRYLWYLLSTDAFYEMANICLAVGSTNQTEARPRNAQDVGCRHTFTERAAPDR